MITLQTRQTQAALNVVPWSTVQVGAQGPSDPLKYSVYAGGPVALRVKWSRMLPQTRPPKEGYRTRHQQMSHVRQRRASMKMKSTCWVLETLPDVFCKLENKKVFIGMSRCSVKLHTAQTQCYNCQRFGHTAAKCNDKPKCKNCAGEHDSRTCKADFHKCANCKGPHKATRPRACKTKDRVVMNSLRRTDFGNQ